MTEPWMLCASGGFIGACIGLMLAQVWGPGQDELALAYRAGFEEGVLAGRPGCGGQYQGGALKLAQRSDA